MECNEHLYTPSIYLSDISNYKLEQLVANSNETSQRYLTAMETLHRVDNILFLETVSALDDVILSNQQLSSLLFNNIVNPATSVTNTILLALQKTATIIEGDANSLKNDILASLETCYYRNIDFIIQSLNSQLETLVQNLASVQMILKMYPNFSNSELLTLEGYQNQIVQLNNTMSRSYDYMGRVNDSQHVRPNFSRQTVTYTSNQSWLQPDTSTTPCSKSCPSFCKIQM